MPVLSALYYPLGKSSLHNFRDGIEDLARLSPQEAVDLFRELLWAEATALGIGKHLINVPTAITIADGGIDAEVGDVRGNSGQGIIKPGLTCYQIKTGNYSLRDKDNVRKLLCTPGSKGTVLEPRVKDCLDRDGTFIVVLFGWDKPAVKRDEFVTIIRDFLKNFDSKYENARLEVWQPNQLIGFLRLFPPLALKVNHRDDMRFQLHQSWSKNADMQGVFERSEVQNKLISELQTILRGNDQITLCHVMGEPGIGKTRSVFEATSAADLSPLVIYCGDAGKFRDSNLMNELLRGNFSAILVLDECDLDDRLYIWNRFEIHSSNLKLITVYSDFISSSRNTILVEIPLLDQSQISNIIQRYGIVKDQADHWADLCDCSPRVAHVIGLNLKNNPDDPLRSLDNVWDRYIIGGDERNSDEVRKRTFVLRYLALFKRFGFGRPINAEADTILNIIKRASSQVDQVTFEEIIETLKTRKILQGGHTLYITPKALHIKLWTDWWKIHGRSFQFDEFLKDLSSTPQLLQWFFEMFRYAAHSGAATIVVNELLSENGPFQKYDFLRTQLGARFFLALTEANPQAALTCLKRTIGTWSREQLLEFTTGRREIVWALERIALWREHFVDAAELLLALAEAENERWSNNASGVFTGLFSLGTGVLASTQASPQERLPVLQEALKSRFKERRLLAIHACNKALEQHFFRNVEAEYQGLRHVTDLWTPKTYGELFDAYRQIWQLLYTQLEYSSADEQQLIVTTLLQRAQSLAISPNLSDMIIDTIEELVQLTYTDKKKILTDVVRILRYNGQKLPQHLRQRWEQVKNTLVGSDFSSQMKRYVGMNLLEDSLR